MFLTSVWKNDTTVMFNEQTDLLSPRHVCHCVLVQWCNSLFQNRDDKSDDVIWHQLSVQIRTFKPFLPRTPQTAGSWSRPAVCSGATQSGRIGPDWTRRQRTNTLTEPSCVMKVLSSVVHQWMKRFSPGDSTIAATETKERLVHIEAVMRQVASGVNNALIYIN